MMKIVFYGTSQKYIGPWEENADKFALPLDQSVSAGTRSHIGKPVISLSSPVKSEIKDCLTSKKTRCKGNF